MAYSEAALELRRCVATNALGEPCGQFAVWRLVLAGGPQLCRRHAEQDGVAVPGVPLAKRPRSGSDAAGGQPTDRPACTCPAYAWPHRPGGGLCAWPDLPEARLLTPAGQHDPDWVDPRSGPGVLVRRLQTGGRTPGTLQWAGHRFPEAIGPDGRLDPAALGGAQDGAESARRARDLARARDPRRRALAAQRARERRARARARGTPVSPSVPPGDPPDPPGAQARVPVRKG